MRRFLYSRWFFLFLAIICLSDLGADMVSVLTGRPLIVELSAGLDFIASVLALWVFLDLQRRRPRKHGDNTHS